MPYFYRSMSKLSSLFIFLIYIFINSYLRLLFFIYLSKLTFPSYFTILITFFFYHEIIHPLFSYLCSPPFHNIFILLFFVLSFFILLLLQSKKILIAIRWTLILLFCFYLIFSVITTFWMLCIFLSCKCLKTLFKKLEIHSLYMYEESKWYLKRLKQECLSLSWNSYKTFLSNSSNLQALTVREFS